MIVQRISSNVALAADFHILPIGLVQSFSKISRSGEIRTSKLGMNLELNWMNPRTLVTSCTASLLASHYANPLASLLASHYANPLQSTGATDSHHTILFWYTHLLPLALSSWLSCGLSS